MVLPLHFVHVIIHAGITLLFQVTLQVLLKFQRFLCNPYVSLSKGGNFVKRDDRNLELLDNMKGVLVICLIVSII